jgi:hypothetical protein
LLGSVGSGALVEGRLRAPIVAIDRLPHGRRALHHVCGLARHGRGAVGGPHLRLRGHCLGAAGHGGTGAKYVCECRVPCARGLAVGRARKLPPLLIAVVGHVSSLVRRVLQGYTCIRGLCELSQTFCGRLLNNPGLRGTTGPRAGSQSTARGAGTRTAGYQCALRVSVCEACEACGVVEEVKRRQTAGVEDRPARRGAALTPERRLEWAWTRAGR